MFLCLLPGGKILASVTRLGVGKCNSLHGWAATLSSVFVLSACYLSFRLIRRHLARNRRQPQLLKYTIRILLMVPIYALEAWFALRFKAHALLFVILRRMSRRGRYLNGGGIN